MNSNTFVSRNIMFVSKYECWLMDILGFVWRFMAKCGTTPGQVQWIFEFFQSYYVHSGWFRYWTPPLTPPLAVWSIPPMGR